MSTSKRLSYFTLNYGIHFSNNSAILNLLNSSNRQLLCDPNYPHFIAKFIKAIIRIIINVTFITTTITLNASLMTIL